MTRGQLWIPFLKSFWYDPTENRTQSASFEGEDAIRYTIELVKPSNKRLVFNCFFILCWNLVLFTTLPFPKIWSGCTTMIGAQNFMLPPGAGHPRYGRGLVCLRAQKRIYSNMRVTSCASLRLTLKFRRSESVALRSSGVLDCLACRRYRVQYPARGLGQREWGYSFKLKNFFFCWRLG